MSKKEDAKTWLRTVAANHLASNARKYTFGVVSSGAATNNTLGLQIDIKPFEGKVVDGNHEWLLVKVARSQFMAVEKAILHDVPDIGATIRVTPYHRRRFDGKLVGEPEESVTNGFRSTTFLIGDSDSRIPIDKTSLKSTYLKEMIEQISKLPVGDGIRNIGNALVDAGGSDPGPVGYADPEDEDAATIRPRLTFAIDTLKYQGELSIELNRAADYYEIVLTQNGMVQKRVEDVDFESLGRQIVELVDDEKWRLAKMEILKAAPAKKLAPVFIGQEPAYSF